MTGVITVMRIFTYAQYNLFYKIKYVLNMFSSDSVVFGNVNKII